MKRRRFLSFFLSIATLLSLFPTFAPPSSAAEVNVPSADVLNIDYSSGNTADANGHAVTAGSCVIEENSGLGTGIKALRTAINYSGKLIGHRYAVKSADYEKIKTSFTIECYFNASSLIGEQAVFSGQQSGGFGFGINEGKLIFYVRFNDSATSASYHKFSFSQIALNSWIHAAATYDGSTVRLYVNGREVDSQTDLPDAIVLPNASSFYVGSDPNGYIGSEFPLSEGSMINRAKLYSTALSAEQIKVLFESLPGAENAGLTLEGDQNAAGVTFGVLSDVHITNYEGTGNNTRLIKALEYFAEKGAASTILAGDVSDSGSNVTYLTNYAKTVQDAKTGDMTVHQTAGNHDRRGELESFSQYIGESGWGHYKINGYHFILLSPDNSKDVGVYDSSKEWLAKQLEIAEADTGDRPIFVFAHHAVKNTVFVSNEWYGNLTEADFSEYPQVVFFSGHSHAPNNHPQSIWQDGFTAINTATLSRVDMVTGYGNSITPEGGKDFAQGLLVTVSGSTVTVTTRDFIADADVEKQVWTFDTAEIIAQGTEFFPYSSSRRAANAKAPFFEETAEVVVDRITTSNITVTFPQAKIDSSDAGDIVYAYRFEIWDSSGKLITSRREWSDFYRIEMAETITKTFPGLEYDNDYTMYIYPINAYGMEGEPLSVLFTTKDGFGNEADVFCVNFSKNGATDAAGHDLIVKGEPGIEDNDYVSGNVASFDGNDDAYMYTFTSEDYQKIEDSFTMELYYKPENTTEAECPFSGRASGGLGFEYTDGELCFYACFNDAWTCVPVPVRVKQWNHVMVTYDGTEIRAYLNGSLQTRIAQTGKLQMPSSTAYKMVIGADVNDYEAAEGQHQCQVAYAKIYSTCKTAKADVLNVDFRTQGSLDAVGHTTKVLGSPAIASNNILGGDTASFDGVDDGYRYPISKADYEKMKYCFTAELYYKPNSLANGTCPFSGQQNGGMGFEHNGSCLKFWVHFNGKYVTLEIPVKNNEWNHAVATYDGTELKTYLNGVLVSSMYQTGYFDIQTTEASRCFVIGGDPGENGSLTYAANCEVAVARVYSIALTAEEVQKCFYDIAGIFVTNQPVMLSSPVLSSENITLFMTSKLNTATEANFIAACYNESGRMLGVTTATKTIDSNTTTVTLAYPTIIKKSDVAKWKVLVTDASGYFPLGQVIAG